MTAMNERELERLMQVLARSDEEEAQALDPVVAARAPALEERLVRSILMQREAEQQEAEQQEAEQRRPWRRGVRTTVLVGVNVLLAAALALVLIQAPSVPSYHLEVTAPVMERLGPGEPPSAQTVQLPPGSMLKFVVRPEQRVVGALTLRCYLQRGESPPVRWDITLEQSQDQTGTYRFSAPRDEVPPIKDWREGSFLLAVVIAREGAQPALPVVQAALRGDPRRFQDFQLITQRFELLPPPP